MDTGYHSTAELGKIVYNFSNSTSLKLSYLGGQSVNGNGDPGAYNTAPVATHRPTRIFLCSMRQRKRSADVQSVCDWRHLQLREPSLPNCGASIPFDLEFI